METPTGLTTEEAIELGRLLFKLDARTALSKRERVRFLALVAKLKKLPAINETIAEQQDELFWKQVAEDALAILAGVLRVALGAAGAVA